MVDIESAFRDFLHIRESQDLKRQLQVVGRKTARHINVGDQEYINFSGNDYLGLTYNAEIIQAIQDGVHQYGAGANASRLITGHLDVFELTEQKIAAFKQKEAALIMVSGYQANVSVLAALFDHKVHKKQPLVFSDKLIHASMHAGCQAAKISQIRFRHNDMIHLQELLEKHADEDAPKFILTETVFSMDGDIAPMNELRALADTHNAFLVVDEAHATGVFGENGQGLGQKADLIIGTFGKAFGVFGAYVACSNIMKEYLVNKCSGLIYATALPPAILYGVEKALDLMPSLNEERAHLQTISRLLKNGLQKMGYETGPTESQIVPMILGEAKAALDFSDYLKTQGYWVIAVRQPTVPKGQSRLRFSLSAAHAEKDIHDVLSAVERYTMPADVRGAA